MELEWYTDIPNTLAGPSSKVSNIHTSQKPVYKW